MNKQRKDEGLKIAEEKPLPNEEEFLSSDHPELYHADARTLETRRI